MPLFRSGGILGIAESALEFALAASEESHPNEYMGMLRGEDASKLGLDEGRHRPDRRPRHSRHGVQSRQRDGQDEYGSERPPLCGVGPLHPNGVLRPSDADLATFGKGKVHIIIRAPYGWDDWQAFDRDGEPIDLRVLNVDPPEEASSTSTRRTSTPSYGRTSGDFARRRPGDVRHPPSGAPPLPARGGGDG